MTSEITKPLVHRFAFALALATLALSPFAVQLARAASWVATGSMSSPPEYHTATLFSNGKVLVAGGDYGGSYLTNAQLYDPALGTWTATAGLSTARAKHTATMLPDGRVLVVGGINSATGQSILTAEVFDPASGTWTPTGSLTQPRAAHTATLLPDGKVLVAGGMSNSSSTWGTILASAEVYDPTSGQWTTTGALNSPHAWHTATLLPDGQVLVASGVYRVTNSVITVTNRAELYDPGSMTWASTGNLNLSRREHTATLLPNGLVLVAGGVGASSSVEVYDPTHRTWATTNSMAYSHRQHTATLLPNGKVLVAGGSTSSYPCELFDPAAGTWSAGPALAIQRQAHTATLLPSGRVLLAGGSSSNPGTVLFAYAAGTWAGTGSLDSALSGRNPVLLTNGLILVAGGYNGTNGYSAASRLYDPTTGSWTATGDLIIARSGHTANLLSDGTVLITGGTTNNSGSVLSACELYGPATGAWSATGSTASPRLGHTATLLPTGKVLLAGGNTSNAVSAAIASAELYDPASGTWGGTGSMRASRYSHAATLLPTGRVLVTGGYNRTNGYLSAAELYDPASGGWTQTGSMQTARTYHSATLLPSGKVLVAGGYNSGLLNWYISSAELYDPNTGTWTTTGSLYTSRAFHTATLLRDGRVLVAGGFGGDTFPSPNNATYLSSVEVYDPITGQWTVINAMSTPRSGHKAILLPNGNVLAIGGYGVSYLASAEVYDVGLGFAGSWQAQVSAITSPVSLGGSLVFAGLGFRGVAEGSGGNSQDSPGDYPVVQLRSLDSGQTMFLRSANWQSNSLSSVPLSGFPPGWAMATVFVNGIPSTGAVLNVSIPVPVATSLTSPRILTNSAFQFSFTNTVGAVLGVLATTNPGLPLSNWTGLGGAAEVAPGQFEFTDSQARNFSRRFYLLRSP
jgi:N-acetylneuraminic acid mutarotase